MCQSCTGVVKAKLVEVQGDQEEYADLIGTSGELHLPGTGKVNNWYSPDNRGDTLTFTPKRVTTGEGKIRVKTKLGNTFVFRIG